MFWFNQGSLLKNFCRSCGVNELETPLFYSFISLSMAFQIQLVHNSGIFCGTPAISDGNLGGRELEKY